jgi:hypothetical protein
MTDREPSRFSDTRKSDNITLPRAVAKVALDHIQWFIDNEEGGRFVEEREALAALVAALAEPVHPGYVIGSHWLETAYSRIAAGEAEADVLAEVLGERGWAKREPATEKQVAEVFKLSGAVYWGHYRDGWRAAERFHGIRKEDK